MKDLSHLEGLDTRELLLYLREARRFPFGFDPFYDGHGEGFTIDEIKSVLSTREHIPSKREGKRLRRERAKRGW
jgi:hypothetical protein